MLTRYFYVCGLLSQGSGLVINEVILEVGIVHTCSFMVYLQWIAFTSVRMQETYNSTL